MAELTNMIVGGVKKDIEPDLGPLGLGIPTVVYGKNLKAGGRRHGMDRGRLLVGRTPPRGEALLAPTEVAHAHPHAASHACPVEV